MPELPEVETVVRYLRPKLEGQTITRAHLPKQYTKALHNYSLPDLNAAIKNRTILSVTRRAKYIVLNFDSGILCIHLRMTGRILLSPPTEADKKYITAWFTCADGSGIYFKDVRKFGRIYFYEDPTLFDAGLGVEPLSAAFSTTFCRTLFHSSKRAMKPLLLDQTKIAGIGNIYADEILWAAGIHPTRNSKTISDEESAAICSHTKRILRKSIKLNGTTFQSFYYGEEASGTFKAALKVFGRTGEACSRCTHTIIKIRVGQRGTHVCPHCQQTA